MNKLIKLNFLLILWITLGCDINDNTYLPTNTFVKIYDDNRFEYEYFPVDIIQTKDDGFLILSEVKFDHALFTSVYVLKTDANGDLMSYTLMDENFARPVDGWSKLDNAYYFVCMDANTLISQLISVDNNGTISSTTPLGGLTYPLVTSTSDGEIIMQSFDHQNNETVLAVVSTSGKINQQVSYSIGAGVEVEKPIIDHLTRNRNALPFAVGKTSDGVYYFNGFFNYTFSLVMTNFGSESIGVCQGQLSQGGISAIASLGNDVFGVARFNFGANFINPRAQIPATTITSSTDLGGNIFAEMETGARTKILDIGQENSLIFATHTQNNQIVLYGFEKDTGTILSTSYLGDGNPYALASLTQTSDGGIVILAQTAIEGRFPRIALFKRDAEFFNTLLQ